MARALSLNKESFEYFANKEISYKLLTISKQHKYSQVHCSLPAGVFLDGDAVAGGSKDLAAPDGHELAALVSACHVIQHCSIVDEGIQFAAGCDN